MRKRQLDSGVILQIVGNAALSCVRYTIHARYETRRHTSKEKERGKEGEGKRMKRKRSAYRRAVEQGMQIYRRLPRTGTPKPGPGERRWEARPEVRLDLPRGSAHPPHGEDVRYTRNSGVPGYRCEKRAFTEQQELDLAGGALAISAEVLVDLLGPLGGLLLAGGAHGAAHPRALAGDGLLSARRRDGNDDDDVDDND